ncbi:hypothetical protein [Rhizobium ruizarguesonis]|uniref:hypothetical protein n=1 Tax=Rhizobium ruizarguesonis TaxID=2081791 RepID=UPI001030DFA3|nr:hypothetical protein [Rhizobium ruizarguesonis]TBD47119.1 hypothetical protein ELH17_08500 [Rhizobium ruizarguesonis]
MPNEWTEELKLMRALATGEKSSAFQTFIAKECGAPLTVRDARSQLYLLTTGALLGRPRLIAVDDAQVILMSVSDLEGILLNLALAKFVEGLTQVPRRKVRNR